MHIKNERGGNMDKELKYQEKNIVRNLKKYLKEMIIIKRTENENVITKSIEETIDLCKSIEISLKNGNDMDQELDEDITSCLNELILITKCYKCAEIIIKDASNEEVDDFKKKINLLIRDRIKDLQMLI
jgi:hypothetical protein